MTKKVTDDEELLEITDIDADLADLEELGADIPALDDEELNLPPEDGEILEDLEIVDIDADDATTSVMETPSAEGDDIVELAGEIPANTDNSGDIPEDSVADAELSVADESPDGEDALEILSDEGEILPENAETDDSQSASAEIELVDSEEVVENIPDADDPDKAETGIYTQEKNNAVAIGEDGGEALKVVGDNPEPGAAAAELPSSLLVELATKDGATVTVPLVLPLDCIENKEDFPEYFPPAGKPAGRRSLTSRRTTGARRMTGTISSSRRTQEVELTPQQIAEMKRKDFHAKLIIYGGLALFFLAFLGLLSYRLPWLAKTVMKKDIDPVWPWSVLCPPKEEENMTDLLFQKPKARAQKSRPAGKAAPQKSASNAAVSQPAEDDDDDEAAETPVRAKSPFAQPKAKPKVTKTLSQPKDDEW